MEYNVRLDTTKSLKLIAPLEYATILSCPILHIFIYNTLTQWGA